MSICENAERLEKVARELKNKNKEISIYEAYLIAAKEFDKGD